MKRRLALALLLAQLNAHAQTQQTQTRTQTRQRTPAQAAPTPTPTPTKDESDESDVVRITTNLVQFDAVVTDKKGRPVTDLSPEDFEVTVDGRRQPITLLLRRRAAGRA